MDKKFQWSTAHRFLWLGTGVCCILHAIYVGLYDEEIVGAAKGPLQTITCERNPLRFWSWIFTCTFSGIFCICYGRTINGKK